jgi:hypothetical protein
MMNLLIEIEMHAYRLNGFSFEECIFKYFSSIFKRTFNFIFWKDGPGSLAQWSLQLPLDQEIVGSTPAGVKV